MTSCCSDGQAFGLSDFGGPRRVLAIAAAATACVLLQGQLPEVVVELPPAVYEASIIILTAAVGFFFFRKQPAKSAPTGKQIDDDMPAKKQTVSNKETARKNRDSKNCSARRAHDWEMQVSARAGNLEKCHELYKHMEKAGEKLATSTYGLVVGACARAGDVDGAEKYLEALIDADAGKPNTTCMNIVISACAKTGNCARAEAWIPRMHELGVEVDLMTYNAVIDACAKASKASRAKMWFDQMIEAGLRPNKISYGSLLHACAKAGADTHAEGWLQHMEDNGLEPCSICFNAVIDACAKAGNMERCEHWIQYMLQRGVQPTVSSYTCVMDQLSKAGKVCEAECWLDKMKQGGVEPDLVSYNMVLNGFAKDGNVERATALYEHMRMKGPQPSHLSCNLLLKVLAHNGMVEAIVCQLQGMREMGMAADHMSFCTAIKVYAKIHPFNDLDGVKAFFEEMRLHGVEPDVAMTNAVLMSCGQIRDGKKADAWINLMLHYGRFLGEGEKKGSLFCDPTKTVDASSFYMAIDACTRSSETTLADKLVHKLEESGLKMAEEGKELNNKLCEKGSVRLRYAMLSTLAQSGQLDKAEKLLEELVEASQGKNADATHVNSFNAVVAALAKKPDLEGAERWVARMLECKLQPDVSTYSCIINACAKSNDIARAEKWMQTMKEAGVNPNIVTYNSVINACARCGDYRRGEAWFAQLDGEGIVPVVVTFNSLINACVKAGYVKRAEDWLREIHHRGVTPDVVSYNTVIRACLSKGDSYRAEEWLQEMHSKENAPWRSSRERVSDSGTVYDAVIQTFARRADTERAVKWLSAALSIGAKLGAESYTGVSAACLKEGKLEEADSWIHYTAAANLPLGKKGRSICTQLAAEWTKHGELERASAIERLLARCSKCKKPSNNCICYSPEAEE